MHNHEDMLDSALTELLEGASLASLIAKYPALRPELEAHAKLVGNLRHMAKDIPSERGLSAALGSARLAPLHATPSPYLAFFTTYRTALMLPVLVLVLVGAGYLARPASNTASPDIMPTQTGSFESGHVPDFAPMPAGNAPSQGGSAPEEGIAPASLKASGETRMMLFTAPAEDASTTATTTSATSTPAQ